MAVLIAAPVSPLAVKAMVLFSVSRFIVSLGPEFTVTLLGMAIVVFKVRKRNFDGHE